jgi:hypothetical protein
MNSFNEGMVAIFPTWVSLVPEGMLAVLKVYSRTPANFMQTVFADVVRNWSAVGTIDAESREEIKSSATDAMILALTNLRRGCFPRHLRGRETEFIDIGSILSLAQLMNQDQKSRIKQALLFRASQPNSVFGIITNDPDADCYQDAARNAAQQL